MTHLDYRILIVDDETEYQKVFQFILNPKGYHVIACSNGKEALQILEKQSIDLVVTDLKMPGMDGNELIKCIHKTYPEINVMVMTAYGTIESAVTSIKNGAQGYFLKGSNPEMMAVEIEKLYKIKEHMDNVKAGEVAGGLFGDLENPEDDTSWVKDDNDLFGADISVIIAEDPNKEVEDEEFVEGSFEDWLATQNSN